MTAASGAAHGLLLRHVVTPDGQLALPVDPAAIARVYLVKSVFRD